MSGHHVVHYRIAQGCEDRGAAIVNMLEKSNNVTKELMPEDLGSAKCCIYVTSYNYGLPATDVEAISPDVPSWLVVVTDVDTKSAKLNFDNYVARWQQSLHEMKIAIKIIPYGEAFEKELLTWTEEETNFAKPDIGARKICLVASPKPKTGKTAIIQLIDAKSNYEMIEMCMDDPNYEITRDRAVSILFVGDEAYDFRIAPFNDCLRKSIFVFNKCDNRHGFVKNMDKTKLYIIEILNSAGWGMTDYHTNKVFVCSALYSGFWAKLEAGEMDVSHFKKEGDFAVWDEFGLPVIRSDYIEDNIKKTLGTFDCFSEVSKCIMGAI